MISILKKINNLRVKNLEFFRRGKNIINDPIFIKTKKLKELEILKKPYRYEIINFLASYSKAKNYLEIGVRNPLDNFDKINIKNKYSVDPGIEYINNPVDFKFTSDVFYSKLRENELKISSDIRFDIIFIDGLHLAEQVNKDIENSLEHLSENGFIVLHDCNPPTEFHARESYNFYNSPAGGGWNGTTWKAFVKSRYDNFSCCIDSDWGVGIISKKEFSCFNKIEENLTNAFFEYHVFDNNRTKFLNLISFEVLKNSLQ